MYTAQSVPYQNPTSFIDTTQFVVKSVVISLPAVIIAIAKSFPPGCNCSTVGSNNPEQCERNGGQCSCKMNVVGRTCDACRPDYFNFTSGQGCTGETLLSWSEMIQFNPLYSQGIKHVNINYLLKNNGTCLWSVVPLCWRKLILKFCCFCVGLVKPYLWWVYVVVAHG